MRLVDFLILVLQAHAATLQTLMDLFGQDVVLAILEESGEAPSENETPTNLIHLFEKEKKEAKLEPSAYQELRGSVQGFHLSEVLEFHLWAYPYYRAFVESPLELTSRISQTKGSEVGETLVAEAIAQAQKWIRDLPLPAEQSLEAERSSYPHWIRFRTEVLKRIGKRTLDPV